MMKFLSNIRFRHLFRKKRFEEAIAYCNSLDFPLPSEAVWGFYKTGCYRKVIDFGYSPQSGRDAVAIGVSLAACGNAAEGTRILREARRKGVLESKLLYDAVRSIARYSPHAALELLDEDRYLPSNFGLYLSLLLASGQNLLADALLEQWLPAGDTPVDPDTLLLQANRTRDQDMVLDHLNTFLAMYDLATVTRKDELAPLSASNLVSAAAAGSVRGPLVTITMPAYNTAARIGPAISSLLAQTYHDIEILVVDDCSTDDTAAIVKEFTCRDARVRLIERTQNGGPYAARNMALANARGDFVMCHDSDDWAHPEKIQRQVAPLLANANLNFTMSKWVRVQDDGLFYTTQIYPLTRLNPASPLFRRIPTLNRAGFYDDVRTGADSEYIARLKLIFGRCGWQLLPQPLAFGAQRAGSLTTDSLTGTMHGEAMNAERLEYWEAWRKKHANARRYRQSLYQPFSG